MAGDTLDVNGMQMYFETHGEGEPLLFLHGGLGAGDNWKHIFPRRRRAIG